MLFYYIRHGDPIYDPNSLTPLGRRQAEAVAKRVSMFGIDRIYASTSERAIQTAQPTCEILKKEMTLLDFTNESHAWAELTVDTPNGKRWLFQYPETMQLFADPAIRQLEEKWYTHPRFAAYDYKKGIDRITKESDMFFASLGYEHIPKTGMYRVTKPNDERIALFAHQGFGLAFLSCLMDIPYPQFTIHFDMGHTGMTVIEFKEIGGYAIPKILTMANDSHLFREGLPLHYNNEVRF